MFSVSQLAVFSPHATFIDRDGGERDACKLSIPCYPFHHGFHHQQLPMILSVHMFSKAYAYYFLMREDRNPDLSSVSEHIHSEHFRKELKALQKKFVSEFLFL